MDLAQALIFSFVAALQFRFARHATTKAEYILWIITGIAWTLAAIFNFTIVAMELLAWPTI